MMQEHQITAPKCTEGGIIAEAWDLPRGYISQKHMHDETQLLFSTAGVMRVITDDGLWTLPPQRALWIPANVNHETHVQNAIQMRTLYIDPKLVNDFFQSCTVINITGLLREMILRSVEVHHLHKRCPFKSHLSRLLLAEIKASEVAPLLLPMPQDPRARRVADALMKKPESQLHLAEWAKLTGASSRTLTRCFARETGMSFMIWRRSARLICSLELLAAGRPVTDVALCVGYESQSAYQVAFKSHFGTSPGRYFLRRDLK